MSTQMGNKINLAHLETWHLKGETQIKLEKKKSDLHRVI